MRRALANGQIHLTRRELAKTELNFAVPSVKKRVLDESQISLVPQRTRL
jgi:hypothetical protein